MSFLHYKQCVENGDTIIALMGHNNMQAIQVSTQGVFNTKFGCFLHSNLIGKRFGTKVYSKNKKGWIYILHPTPELWTTILPHRTQILYTTDISMVLLQLNLKPGSVVAESGTGSGSMSHAIARAVAPSGHLYTFEFHEQRAQTARSEFSLHGLADLVTVSQRNVITDGFGLDHIADAVFLDLPSPWDAIKTSKDALKITGGHLCSFSPCIEQVQCTCAELEKQGFKDIRTMECLLRLHKVKTISLQSPTFETHEDEPEIPLCDEPPKKRARGDTEDNGDNNEGKNDGRDPDDETKWKSKAQQNVNEIKTNTDGNLKTIDVVTARPFKQMPGHTGYLTFAVLYQN